MGFGWFEVFLYMKVEKEGRGIFKGVLELKLEIGLGCNGFIEIKI